MNYKITISYDGGKYKGWQRLGGNEATVQGKIEELLSKYFNEKIEIIGASRTDSGVNALKQVANFQIDKELNTELFLIDINHYLPEDIAITKIKKVDSQFHSRYNAISKTYRYRIWTLPIGDPFQRKYYYYVKDKLDLVKMREISETFIGEHDFTTFTNAKSKKKSMVRNISKIEIVEKENYIDVIFTGNGFLYNMVRKLMTIIIEGGHEKTTAKKVKAMIKSKDRSLIKYMVPSKALTLTQIDYK
ncbi:MAG: tRNA pseudouridine(38-40) synthase TruA [Alkaliphilus sp.]|nr:MAG: tRNA pseudouridine(38-40) synthase TruA [Alkaliphilus sp.]